MNAKDLSIVMVFEELVLTGKTSGKKFIESK